MRDEIWFENMLQGVDLEGVARGLILQIKLLLTFYGRCSICNNKGYSSS